MFAPLMESCVTSSPETQDRSPGGTDARTIYSVLTPCQQTSSHSRLPPTTSCNLTGARSHVASFSIPAPSSPSRASLADTLPVTWDAPTVTPLKEKQDKRHNDSRIEFPERTQSVLRLSLLLLMSVMSRTSSKRLFRHPPNMPSRNSIRAAVLHQSRRAFYGSNECLFLWMSKWVLPLDKNILAAKLFITFAI